jgi:hypothetical protein
MGAYGMARVHPPSLTPLPRVRVVPPSARPLFRPAWVARQLRFKRVLRAIPLIFTA